MEEKNEDEEKTMTKIHIGMQIFLGILMGILLITGVNLGISAFYPAPDYQNYCNWTAQPVQYNTQELCIANNGTWNPNYGPKEVNTPNGYCDTTFKCNNAYEQDRKAYESQIFYVLEVIGVILAGLGLFIFGSLIWQIIFTGGGIALVIEGVIRNFNQKIPAFIATAIAFIILSIFIYKKVDKK